MALWRTACATKATKGAASLTVCLVATASHWHGGGESMESAMQLSEWLSRNDASGKVSAMVGVQPGHVALHPEHHATCFCAVCRGEADGHIGDPCECGKCH